jgi:uncharacterized membrane protein (DUF2068 family)
VNGVVFDEGEPDDSPLAEAIALQVDQVIQLVLIEHAIIAMRSALAILGGCDLDPRVDLVLIEGVQLDWRIWLSCILGDYFLH